MKGLKLEPGWRQAWVTWLNLLRLKSKPPTRARMAPSVGSGGDEGGLDLGQLHDLPVALVVLLHADDGAAPQALVGGRLVVEHALGELQAFAGNLHRFRRRAVGLHQLGPGFEDDGGVDVVEVGLSCSASSIVSSRALPGWPRSA
jgi:hypothetical protein